MDNDSELTNYIVSLIETNGSIDVAEAEFKRIMADDHDLRDQYREWCDENGYTPRRGFMQFAEEYNESREAVWDSLSDYDEYE
jgi:hypothetical protein